MFKQVVNGGKKFRTDGVSEKVKVACDFRKYREWHDQFRYNVDDFRVGAIKNVVLRAS